MTSQITGGNRYHNIVQGNYKKIRSPETDRSSVAGGSGRAFQALSCLYARLSDLRHNVWMKPETIARRRREVMDLMGSGVVILPTAPVRKRSHDVDFPYHPDSDFFYLTQFPEPEAVAVLVPGREHGEFILFCRE